MNTTKEQRDWLKSKVNPCYPQMVADVIDHLETLEQRLAGYTTPEYSRLLDLVRYKRGELYTDGLITTEEYNALMCDVQGSPARLESYDAVQLARKSAEDRVAATLEELGDGSQVGDHGVLCRAVIEEKSGDPQISGDVCCCAFGRLRAILRVK